MPYPPRIAVLPLPKGSQAKLKRGARFIQFGSMTLEGNCGSPLNSRPRGALAYTVDCRPGRKELSFPLASVKCRSGCHRRPRVTVSFGVTLISSDAKNCQLTWLRLLPRTDTSRNWFML